MGQSSMDQDFWIVDRLVNKSMLYINVMIRQNQTSYYVYSNVYDVLYFIRSNIRDSK